MRTRRLLLAATVLSTGMLGACEKKKPVRYANDKRPMYEPDAGVAPSDAADANTETVNPPPAEPK